VFSLAIYIIVMYIPLMLISIATLFFPVTTSTPIKSARDVTVFNADNAYQISRLAIFIPSANSTVNRTITFTVEDPNPGMALKTVCSKSANGPLENDMFNRCENDFFHFSLRVDGTIWLYRFIRDARYVFTRAYEPI
jgi:hypothetical protein